MHRIVLSLSLALAGTLAMAAEPGPATQEAGACAKSADADPKQAEATSSEPAATPGATAPVRARGSGAAGRPVPRWNSLLPGMIR